MARDGDLDDSASVAETQSQPQSESHSRSQSQSSQSQSQSSQSQSQAQTQTQTSKRPSLTHRDSGSQSDTTSSALSLHQQTQHRSKQHHHHHKHHHVGRAHARVPSTKALHKQHAPAASKPSRRAASPTESDPPQRPPHRRAISDFKPRRHGATTPNTSLVKSTSHTSLQRNRSSIDIGKRTRSTDKLKRTSSGTGIHKSGKSQVHFDLGDDDDDQDGEWVDASGSNSPYLSRKGSLNSSAQSSLRPGPHSAANSRPETPNEPTEPKPEPDMPAPERARAHQKEYLTSRLLQRSLSGGAPPQMTTDMAQVTPQPLSPSSTDPDTPPPPGSNHDELISRFVDVPSSGLTSEGSFYNHGTAGSRRSEETPRRPQSMASYSQSHGSPEGVALAETDNSAMVPRTSRRTSTPTAQTSRTQQKLNLQRASSVIEPSQTGSGVGGGTGAIPLIGVGGPGYDGGSSRDPRVNKLLERTGMEYLVVRRYQNPVARSLNRVARRPGMDKSKRIPRPNTGIANGKRTSDLSGRHVRNVSMPDPRQTATSKKPVGAVRANGAGSSFEGDETSRLAERLSGTSLVGTEEEDGVASLLRNLWEKSMDLSASTD